MHTRFSHQSWVHCRISPTSPNLSNFTTAPYHINPSLFNLTSTANESYANGGVVNYASAMVLEVVNTTGSDVLGLRMKFKNGTADSDFKTIALPSGMSDVNSFVQSLQVGPLLQKQIDSQISLFKLAFRYQQHTLLVQCMQQPCRSRLHCLLLLLQFICGGQRASGEQCRSGLYRSRSRTRGGSRIACPDVSSGACRIWSRSIKGKKGHTVLDRPILQYALSKPGSLQHAEITGSLNECLREGGISTRNMYLCSERLKYKFGVQIYDLP
jgi:hypothetical protein